MELQPSDRWREPSTARVSFTFGDGVVAGHEGRNW